MKYASIASYLAAALGLALALPAAAQYEGPGFAACMHYGEQRLMQGGAVRSVVFVNDADTIIEKYTDKVGSQLVSSVLTGKATLERNAGPARKVRYICLLADDKTPVFFHVTDEK